MAYKLVNATDLKENLIKDRRTSNISCGVMRTIFEIIDEMQDSSIENVIDAVNTKIDKCVVNDDE